MSLPAPSNVRRRHGVRAVGITQPLRWLALGWLTSFAAPYRAC